MGLALPFVNAMEMAMMKLWHALTGWKRKPKSDDWVIGYED